MSTEESDNDLEHEEIEDEEDEDLEDEEIEDEEDEDTEPEEVEDLEDEEDDLEPEEIEDEEDDYLEPEEDEDLEDEEDDPVFGVVTSEVPQDLIADTDEEVAEDDEVEEDEEVKEDDDTDLVGDAATNGVADVQESRSGSKAKVKSRLKLRDVINVGSIGLRSRKTRTILTATGIAIGVAALISIFGITEAGNANAQAEIDALGADMLLVGPGAAISGDAELLPEAPGMLDLGIPGIDIVSAVYPVPEGKIRRNGFIPETRTNGIAVVAIGPSDTDLLEPINASVITGRFHDSTSVEVPTVVLGSLAADRLGINDLSIQPTVDISGHPFHVIGILDELGEFNADFNRNAIIGLPVAQNTFDAEDVPANIYLQVPPERLDQVRNVVPEQANPETPNEVAVSRPTEALEAKQIIEDTFRQLLIAVAAITALVGAIGVANVMVISALERRGEIGLRRSLGATQTHIAVQFLVESMLLSSLGGLLGTAGGLAVTLGWTQNQGWAVRLPWEIVIYGIAGAALVGAVAGLYPAIRASRMDPAEAVRPAN